MLGRYFFGAFKSCPFRCRTRWATLPWPSLTNSISAGITVGKNLEHTHQSSAPTPYHARIRRTSNGVQHDFRGEDVREGRIGDDNPRILVVLSYQMLDPLACGINL